MYVVCENDRSDNQSRWFHFLALALVAENTWPSSVHVRYRSKITSLRRLETETCFENAESNVDRTHTIVLGIGRRSGVANGAVLFTIQGWDR